MIYDKIETLVQTIEYISDSIIADLERLEDEIKLIKNDIKSLEEKVDNL